MAVVQTIAGLEALEKSPSFWLSSTPTSLKLYAGTQEDYAALWRKQPNVRTVVSFLARNIAQLGIKSYRRVSDTDREHLRDHGVARTIRKPNARTTRFRMLYALVSDMAVYENAYWLKLKTSGGLELYRIPPSRVAVEGENWLFAESFSVRGSRGEVRFPASSIVHFHLYNPEDPRWGVSPLESLRRILAEEASAGDYREAFWSNAARIEGVLSHPGKLTKPSADRIREDWERLNTGTAASGRTAILEEGMDFKPISFSAKDSQYLEVRKLTREEVAAAYHIPPPMVGVLDHATFSNISHQHRMLYQDTLGPWLTMITEELELQLLPEFDDVDDVYLEFNIEEKLRGSFEEQAGMLQTAVGAPYMTRDEARAKVNLPSIPGGDELVTPLNVLVGGQASPTDSAPPPKAVETVLRDFFVRQEKAVLSRLGRGDDLQAVLAWDRWNRELEKDLQAIGVSTDAVPAVNAQTLLMAIEAHSKHGVDGVKDVFDHSCNGRLRQVAALVAQGGA